MVRVEEVSVVLRGPERVRTEVKVLRCPRCLDTVSAPTATQSTGGDGT